MSHRCLICNALVVKPDNIYCTEHVQLKVCSDCGAFHRRCDDVCINCSLDDVVSVITKTDSYKEDSDTILNHNNA
jgi:ribosome-binding protein aMBF1 (putative translation factor)